MAVGTGSILRATNAKNNTTKNNIKQTLKDDSGMKKNVDIVTSLSDDKNILIEIEIDKLENAPKTWQQNKINEPVDELMKSIEKYGLIEPLIVRQVKENDFQILSGTRRKKALQQLGENKALCRVLMVSSEKEAKELYYEINKFKSKVVTKIETKEIIKEVIIKPEKPKKISDKNKKVYTVVSSLCGEIPDYLL